MSKVPQQPVDMPEPEEWVVPACRSPLHFWQQYQHTTEWPGPALLASNPGQEGDVLVIRGFDNLLHYLDWFDSVYAASGKPSARTEN